MISIRFLLFIFILNTPLLKAQILKDENYKKNILSVKFYPEGWELGHPILLNENKTNLILSFDFMGEEQPALAYRILQCNANWEKSKVVPSSYLKNGFNKFYIEGYRLSTGTKRLYTHYTLRISSDQLKLSGNYIIQVFPEDNPEATWLQMRFLYSESNLTIEGNVQRAIAIPYHKTHQRLQFEVEYDKIKLPNARTNITTVVSQNLRWDNAQLLRPLFVNNQLLRFSYIDKKGLFAGNHEFPYFDTSNILQETHSIRTLEQNENGEMHCYLYPNEAATNNYFYIKDMNGNFTIASENTFEPDTEADYVWVHFTFLNKELPSDVFVVGRFNQWKATKSSRLVFDAELGLYHVGLLLKQGVYNYTFVTKEASGQLKSLLGSYSETENDYYIFVYYSDERLQTDRLVGWKRLNSGTNY